MTLIPIRLAYYLRWRTLFIIKNNSVEAQFHRYPNNRGVWLYTDRSNRGAIATEEWNKFILHFGIKVGEMHDPIPVYMDFYQDKTVIIRLR